MVTCLLAFSLTTSLVAESRGTGGQAATQWKTNNDDFIVSNITRHSVKGTASKISLDFRGKPLSGSSKSQGISFESESLIGDLLKSKDGRFYLDNAKLSESVVVTRVSAEGNDVLRTSRLTLSEAADRTSSRIDLPVPFTLTGRSAKIEAGSGTVNLSVAQSGRREFSDLKLSGGYVVDMNRVRGDQSETIQLIGNTVTLVDLNGGGTLTSPGKLDAHIESVLWAAKTRPTLMDFQSGGGTIALAKTGAGGRPIDSADLVGPIVVNVRTFSAPDAEGGGEPVVMKATGDRLTFDENGVLTLRGHVKLDLNNGQALYGTGDTLTVEFDRNMNVMSWETKGGPATIEAKPGSGSGAGTGGGGGKR